MFAKVLEGAEIGATLLPGGETRDEKAGSCCAALPKGVWNAGAGTADKGAAVLGA